MGATAAMSRAFLVAFNRVEVLGLPNFLAVLDARRSAQQRKRGLITGARSVKKKSTPDSQNCDGVDTNRLGSFYSL